MTTCRETIVAFVLMSITLLASSPSTLVAAQTVRDEQSPAHAKQTKHALYKQKPTLGQTLLTNRQRYAAWQVAQPLARKAVVLEPWWTTPLLSTDEARDVKPTEKNDLSAKRESGGALWSKRKQFPDGKVTKFIAGSSEQGVYLTRVFQANRKVQLTVGMGGGDHLDAWLNGQKILSADTHLNTGQYGVSIRVDGTRVDQVLLDLDLVAGANTLVVRLTPAEEPAFYFSTSPNPVPRFWEQLRQKFPAMQNPLIDLVHADWFETDGWFAARDNRFEKQFIEQCISDCGSEGLTIRAELEQLSAAKVDPNDNRWLDLCVKSSVLAKLHDDLTKLTAAVKELGRSHPGEYPADQLLADLQDYRQRLNARAAKRLDPADQATRRLLTEMPQMRRRMLVELNPLLQNAEIVFVKRSTYNSKHYYDDFQHISRWGGNLCVLSLADGSVREIAPELSGGVFDRYDLSFDGKRIVFGYRRPKPEGFRIYEIGVDGRGLRQVTHPPADEEQRIATYGKTSMKDSFFGLMGYEFWTDDSHPCYLPDGDISFVSTRSEHAVLCNPGHYLACTNLYRMKADGSALRPISYGTLSEFTPTMLADGRILYNRWEYIYKGIAAVQPLWIMRPDGSGSEEFYGNNIANPGVFWQARQVPGNPQLVVCIGCGHEPLGVGQVLLLDLSKDKRTTDPIISLTPNVKTENLRGLFQRRNGVWREDIYGPLYADPYPLSDKFFLVSCNPDKRYNDPAGYGIYLLDAFGNRVPIYHDPQISSWQPMLRSPRQTPPVISLAGGEISEPKTSEPKTSGGSGDSGVSGGDAPGTLFVNDVYRGMSGVDRGTVKYIRVMEQVPKPWAAEIDLLRGEDRRADGAGGRGHIAIGLDSHIWVALLLGVVPVEDDGSAYFQVPPKRNLFFQALDENFMEVQRMRTFVSLEPGETRSCNGCHDPQAQAPPVSHLAMALSRPPAKLAAQPGDIAPRPLHYPTNVQPILDSHCVSCHNGADPNAQPDLRSELTMLFSRSYENILQAGLVHKVREWPGADYAMQNAQAVPPYSHGSHRSRLVQMLKAGHHNVKLSKTEWIKLVTWIDCGVPYYGSYFGRRNIKYQGQPDFRPVPTLNSARGIQPAVE